MKGGDTGAEVTGSTDPLVFCSQERCSVSYKHIPVSRPRGCLQPGAFCGKIFSSQFW